MRVLTTAVILGLLGLSGWLFSEQREANRNFNSCAVTAAYSQMVEARRIETMILSEDYPVAMDELQKLRDVSVLQFDSMRTAISEWNYRWGREEYLLERMNLALREEASFRQESPQRTTESTKINNKANNVLNDLS